ncbi:hypothetical protein HDU84_004040 [Entophlyctis sp. JEL0112]|nr:hypothetical protein HDU84_004040 [Entophlyctis sp. JEL0112]
MLAKIARPKKPTLLQLLFALLLVLCLSSFSLFGIIDVFEWTSDSDIFDSSGGDVDSDQVNFLDFLNGEWEQESHPDMFGGSLIDNKLFSPTSTWKRVYRHAQNIASKELNESDFHELVLYARAHYITYSVLHHAPTRLKRQLRRVSPERDITEFHRNLENTTVALETRLYPWLWPPFRGGVAEMHRMLLASAPPVGLAMTTGEAHFYPAQHLLLALRRVLNVSEPIEVFHSGRRDLPKRNGEVLRAIPHVSVRNLQRWFPHETAVNGHAWSYKAFALLAAHARVVLFMDPDVAFMKNPVDEVLRNSKLFAKHGALFFRDRKIYNGARLSAVRLFNQMNPHMSLRARSGFYAHTNDSDGRRWTTEEQESGFMALDKSRPGVLIAALFAAKLNSRGPRTSVFYRDCHGDKEAYWFAFESLRVPYGFTPAYSGSIGVREDDPVPEVLASNQDSENEETEHTAAETIRTARVCDGRHAHMDETGEQLFWFHDGGVIDDYRRSKPPRRQFKFATLTHIAMHTHPKADELPWTGVSCLRRPVDEVVNLTSAELELVERYKEIYRTEITVVEKNP